MTLRGGHEMPEISKITRIQQKSSFLIFEDTMKKLGLTETALCAALGYAENTAAQWRSTTSMPKVASIACRALVMEKENSRTKKEKIFLVRAGNKEEALKVVLSGLNLEFIDI